MNKHSKTDEISAILGFPFQDENWVGKLAVATGVVFVGFIPLVGIFSTAIFLGYLAEIIRMIVVDGKEPRLPDWKNLSRFFEDGFSLFGVGLVFSLPAFVLLGIGYLSMFAPVFAQGFTGMSESEGIGLILIGYLGGYMLFGLGALYSIAAGVVYPAAACHVVAEGKFSAGFQFKEWWKIFTANWSGFLVSFLILFGGGMVLSYAAYFLVITIILCCLYPVVVGLLGAYLGIVGMALFGKAYRTGIENHSQKEAEV